MKRFYLILFCFLLGIILSLVVKMQSTTYESRETLNRFWLVQSIDTMKFSRDLALIKANDPEFDKIIDLQIQNIANTGATHVAIATPYDEQFFPFLLRWVTIARKHNLSVWFRGNLAGWEGWFNTDKINREQHVKLVENFILKHPNVFQDGDLFTSCHECENGGPGDPRINGDVVDYRKFLILEYETTKKAFQKINKKVPSNFFSMNLDVAKLIMDKSTTTQLGSIITIDHYTSSPDQLAQDIHTLAKTTGGKIILGEFGVPIPDINGVMTENEQASWIEQALTKLHTSNDLIGLNYWTSVGGSTEIWTENAEEKSGVKILTRFFRPNVIKLSFVNALQEPLPYVLIATSNNKLFQSNESGTINFPYISTPPTIAASLTGYSSQEVTLTNANNYSIMLANTNPNLLFNLKLLFQNLIGRIRF